VDQHRPQRLFLDGIEPFLKSESIDSERTSKFLTALTNELRIRRVTVMMTQQVNALFSTQLNSPTEGIEAIIDNILFLRFVEMRSQLYRMISVMKMRESDNDPALRLFSISSRGIHVEETFEGAEAVLTGQARPLSPEKKGKKAQRKSLLRRRNRS
jgi:circadian clock protein KaiC